MKSTLLSRTAAAIGAAATTVVLFQLVALLGLPVPTVEIPPTVAAAPAQPG